MEKEQLNGIEKSENEINDIETDMDAEKIEPPVSEEMMIKLRKLFYQIVQ